MVLIYVMPLVTLISLTTAAPASYQHVRYVTKIRNGAYSTTSVSSTTGSRIPRGPFRSFVPEELFAEEHFITPNDAYNTELDSVEHSGPNYNNRLDYPDPYLLTGVNAHAAVNYLYGKGELFFADYPHVKAVLEHQEERRRNGLNEHIIGSIRFYSPFLRPDF